MLNWCIYTLYNKYICTITTFHFVDHYFLILMSMLSKFHDNHHIKTITVFQFLFTTVKASPCREEL